MSTFPQIHRLDCKAHCLVCEFVAENKKPKVFITSGLHICKLSLRPYFTEAMSCLKVSGSFIARSASTFLSSVIPFKFNLCMNCE